MPEAVKRSTIEIAGAKIEVNEIGSGAPVLFLHGGSGPVPGAPFFAMLARGAGGAAARDQSGRRIVMPTHPGFGGSSLPDWLDSCDDIAHIHLELMDRLKISKCELIGGSIGGWIAAEMATKAPDRFGHLVLLAPVGVKTGPVDKLDIPDMFATPLPELQKMLFHDPEKFKPNPAAMSEEQLLGAVRARETLALLAWEPYMHNPKLNHRLQRIACPTLFIRGASDGLVSAAYIERYARLIKGARIETIAACGHVPHVEQSEATAAAITKFLQ